MVYLVVDGWFIELHTVLFSFSWKSLLHLLLLKLLLLLLLFNATLECAKYLYVFIYLLMYF